jgi:predicted dehydrogenase
VHTIRYSITLPPNPRFEDFATEVVTRPSWPPADRTDPEVAAGMIYGGIMGLAIHDLPLVRAFCPDFTDLEVRSCALPHPGGYLVNLRVGEKDVQVSAVNTHSWEPEWTVEAIGDDAALRIDFTPSYVQAGSATAVLRRGAESVTYGPYASNGYEEEWRFLARLAQGDEQPLDLEELIDDLTFALALAGEAADAMRATVLTEKEAAA